jgi:hypothetical protein
MAMSPRRLSEFSQSELAGRWQEAGIEGEPSVRFWPVDNYYCPGADYLANEGASLRMR